ncbi:NYN domain-containing protein [Microtetraspora sp. NBRC 16547]|uniref:NYN domain-containing protein n=1 Tax=Microtetraspora sp. NBRC 16547 TaxID=3030993 RepID=UPI003323A32F
MFVDAGYLLADGALAAHGTHQRESVSWDYPGLLHMLTGLCQERTGLPLLRCYWYEATVEGRRTTEHDALADLPGLKLRLARIRPGRREGVDAQVHRDLMTLARNNAVCDAVVLSGDEDLAQVVSDAQDLGIRVTVIHIAVEGGWAASRPLRQESDDLIEIGGVQLRPYTTLSASADAGPGHANGQQPALNGQPLQNGFGQLVNGTPANGGSGGGSGGGSNNGALGGGALGGGHAAPTPSSGASHAGPAQPAYAGYSPDPQPAQLPVPVPTPTPVTAAPPAQMPISAQTPPSTHGSPSVAPPAQVSPTPISSLAPVSPPPLPAPIASPPAQVSPASPSTAQNQHSGSSTNYFAPSASAYPSPGLVPLGPYTGPQPTPPPSHSAGTTTTLAESVQAAHKEGFDFGESVARDAPVLWLEAVLARKPRMPSDLEARLLQGSSLPIDFLLHEEVRQALRRGFWDALERARR